jgi:hypothetical protein
MRDALKIRLLCLLAALSLVASAASPVPRRNKMRDKGTMRQPKLANVVLSILEDSGRPGSLEYQGVCTASGDIAGHFRISAPQHDLSPLQALQRAFVGDSEVTATKDASGLIRVVAGVVPTDLLNLRIPEVTFRQERDPRDAEYKLLALPDVHAYMQAHHITFIQTMYGLIPPPSGRILNVTLKGQTLSAALDRVAETFPGVWVYGECTSEGERHVLMFFHEFSARMPGHQSSRR